uniref:Domain of unknown function DB domain-containing protein n=1 Tax=Plectus sambesii TaxID=2011161 RepID=A0A914W1C5_9BILA
MQAWCSSFCQDVHCEHSSQVRSAEPSPLPAPIVPVPASAPFLPGPRPFQGKSHIEEIVESGPSIPHYVDIATFEEEDDGTLAAGGQTRPPTQDEPDFSTIGSSLRKAQIAEPVAVCGVAPNYTPCVPLFDANQRMQTCCQQKNLPPGCVALCQYQVTQAQVKFAFDSGACGLLHISPFIECAAGGQNNVQCCRDLGLIASSGAQCEPFCFPSGPGGLGLLGIQHIVCGEVMERMIGCHHSGLKS